MTLLPCSSDYYLRLPLGIFAASLLFFALFIAVAHTLLVLASGGAHVQHGKNMYSIVFVL